MNFSHAKSATQRFGRMVNARKTLSRLPFFEFKRVDDNIAIDHICEKCIALLGARGQASGVKVAQDIIAIYDMLSEPQKLVFFKFLLVEFGRDKTELVNICRAYQDAPSHDNLKTLIHAVEPKRQELFRRINMAPGGTSALIQIREDLLAVLREHPDLKPVDMDFLMLFKSWFNRGFLTMEPISWSSPAIILELLIAYEAVHEITSWEDLKRRLNPEDRMCYAFFHPNLPAHPLIFVEVALCADIPGSIQDILSPERDVLSPHDAKVATFYSINNCLTGLRGVSFGNFLIKQVVENLRVDHPRLNRFVTLSPIPGLVKWLLSDGRAQRFDLSAEDIRRLETEAAFADPAFRKRLEQPMRKAALAYLLDRQPGSHRLVDSVARFHLGNGARIENVQWAADTSERGRGNAFGMMVNYLYELDQIEDNHEAFAVRHEVTLSNEMRALSKGL